MLTRRSVCLLPLASRLLPSASSRILDTHTHFYDPARPQGVPWPKPGDPVLYQTTLPDRFVRLTRPLGVTGTVVVEASPWLEDNQWVLDLARDNPVIVGLVGNLQPGTPEFKDHLARFRKNRLLLGIRLNGKVIADRLPRPEFIEDLKRLADAGLELDTVGGAAMLPELVRLTDRLPALRMVIDHLPFDPPSSPALRELGARPLVYAKVSNVLRRTGDRVTTELSYYREVLDELWDIFGEKRLVYGSNWPVSDRVAPYADVLKVVMDYFRARGPAAVEHYFWKNSLAAYRWR